MIKRDIYLNKLISRRHNGMVKVITGIRRCGKSYLLNQIFYAYLLSQGVEESHIIRFSFDAAEDLQKMGESLLRMEKEKRGANPELFLSYVDNLISGDGMYYLLLDEVQMLGCFESVLNGYLRKPNLDIYVTGSNAKFLSKDVITEFAGRGDEIPMHPLSFKEFMSVYPGDKYAGLAEYMAYGGIPLVVLGEDEGEKTALLQSLFDEIYLKDIYRRNGIRKTGEIEDLLNVISSSVGSLTNPSKLKNTFWTVKKSNITASTIQRYLDYLEDSFLIESAERYDVRGKAYIETPRKYYFSDVGLRNARIRFRQNEENHIMENVLYNELRLRGYQVDVGVVPISSRDEKGNSVRKRLKVDFVCNLGSKRVYVQSACSLRDETKMEQELRPYRHIDDSFAKIIVTKDIVVPHYNEEGVFITNIYDFLLNDDWIR